jgi:RHS repeat-associated protein
MRRLLIAFLALLTLSNTAWALNLTGANLTREYVRGSDMGGGVGGVLWDVTPGNGPAFYHYDGRGDVIGTGSGSGLTHDAYTADGYHGSDPLPGLAGGSGRLQANTKMEEGVNYILLNDGQRYRDVFSGRFLTRDPLGYVDGTNEFNYVRNNPWTSWDPEGLQESTGDQIAERNKLLKELAPEGAPSDERLQAAKDLANGLKNGTEAVASLDPVVNASEAATGTSVTGEKLGWFDRALAFFGLIDGPVGDVGKISKDVKEAKVADTVGQDASKVVSGSAKVDKTASKAAAASTNGGKIVSVATIRGGASGVKATMHGAERLLERGFTEAEITAIKNGRIMTQADGAKVFINEVSPGKFNYIVEGENGIITGIKNIDQKALNNLAKNYGWH